MSTVASNSARHISLPAAEAEQGPMPGFIQPCDPVLQERAPTGSDWVYEIKTDGYRAQVHIRNSRVTVYSRSGYAWTDEFAPIAKAASKLKVRDAIIDGEATVLGETGLPDFQALRRELRNRETSRLLYHAFDLLYLNGRDLRRAPLLRRKQALKSLLKEAPPTLVYVDFLEADGKRVFEYACRMGLEGIVAKRTDAPYRSGRQDTWIKLKCVKSDTFPIIAFVEKLGARPRKIASLYVGRWDDDQLVYAGKARSGYTETVARELRERLDPLIRKTTPLSIAVKKPKLVDAALRMRQLLEAEGLSTWPKLTGGKGIHIMAPLPYPLLHDEAHRYALRLVGILAERDPKHYILSVQQNRRGRIFLDYLRNGRGTTAIGAYSPRVREGFPIAAPVSWSRIEAGIRPDAFTMKSPFRDRSDNTANRPVRKRVGSA